MVGKQPEHPVLFLTIGTLPLEGNARFQGTRNIFLLDGSLASWPEVNSLTSMTL